MPFCPKCKAEYEFGVGKCSDCQIPLVSQLPEQQKNDNLESNLVSLTIVNNEIEAIFICDLLNQAGIEASYRSSLPSGKAKLFLQETPYFGWNEILSPR